MLACQEAQPSLPSASSNPWKDFIAIGIMLLGVVILYLPPHFLSGNFSIANTDYDLLHRQRMLFAEKSLAQGTLPSWYPHELCGTPFWSNIQNFPFIPNRLLLFLFPDAMRFWIGITLAAMLGACATYAFARLLGLSRLSAAVTGWTFVASGYYSSRVLAGHLPLLEAYFGLPLLLCLAEYYCQNRKRAMQHGAFILCCLGLTAAIISLGGHPQIPFYSLVIAFCYVIARNLGRASMPPILALAFGALIASFVIYPMFNLVQHSSRFLPLDPPRNDVFFDQAALLRLFLPWRLGYPKPLWQPGLPTFAGNAFAFWDSSNYMGWIPWLGLFLLLVVWVRNRTAIAFAAKFLIAVGMVSLITATPLIQTLSHHLHIHGTVFRSPARQLYVTTFCLAMGLGFALNHLQQLAGSGRKIIYPLLAAIVIFHVYDLGKFSRTFMISRPPPKTLPPRKRSAILSMLQQGRVVYDPRDIPIELRNMQAELYQVGFYDSILPADTYQALLALSKKPKTLNTQGYIGLSLPVAAMRYLGVRFVLTEEPMPQLEQTSPCSYRVAAPSPLARFISLEGVVITNRQRIFDRLRNFDQAFIDQIAFSHDLPAQWRATDQTAHPTPSAPVPGVTRISRPNSDTILISYASDQPGFIKVIESWDPGWLASVNGIPAPILKADGFLMGIPVPTGSGEIRLQHHTPGFRIGLLLSILGALGLLTICVIDYRNRPGNRICT